MLAVKNWFLEKNDMRWMSGSELTIIKETAKAVLVKTTANPKYEYWIPKSCLVNEWEKDTSNFGYHEYLVNAYHKAYEDQKIENYTIKSGRNRYRGDAFIHQLTTKELIEKLEKNGIEFMNRKEWNAR